ncbi:MAG: hypothetical protein A2081_04925 [Elusimicrobia bacterium GWC2_61_19]|nr:MAG: hypothetical protein A2081_04925 [Elusimicrobia bacterium GWC2_61_19]
MKKLLCAAVFFLFSAASARAYTDTGGRYTAGPDGYGGVNIFAEWGDDDYYLRPSLNTYKSDIADRFSTYSLGGGLERERWSAGAEVSMTPETGGYKNYGIYGDLSYKLLAAPAEDAALEDISLGAFAGLTAHEDTYALSTTTVVTSGRRSSVATLTDAFKLNQADYGLSASVKACGLRASGRFTKTAYDKDVTAEARQLPVDIGSIGTSGFPDTAVSARLRAAGLPLSPEAGYTRTTYLLDQPDSESLTFGLSVKAGPAEISAGWEGFNPGGGADRLNYYSVGLTLSF